jgi:hypothetical protein
MEMKEVVIWQQEKRDKYLGITKGNPIFLSPNQEVDMTCVCFRHLTAVHGSTNI